MNGMSLKPLSLKIITILAIFSLLLASIAVSSFVSSADDPPEEDLEEVEVPEWKKGYSWTYKMREPIYEGTTFVNEIKRRVEGEGKFAINEVDAGENEYPTYVVNETWQREEEDESSDIYTTNHFTKDKLSRTFTNPVDGWASFYYPPIIEMDFPLSVGDTWIKNRGYFFETQEVETDEELEPVREIVEYAGEVEKRVSKEVEIRGVKREFETLMINFTTFARDIDPTEKQAELRRDEIYYSPEVKNVVHREMYQTMRVPEDYEGPSDDKEVEENWVGNETLLDYSLEAVEENDDGETSLLGVGVVLLMLGVGTASIYVYKKVKNSV